MSNYDEMLDGYEWPDEDVEEVADPAAKYPQVTVQLSGRDGNAFAVLAAVRQGLRAGGVPKPEQDAFLAEAMAGDYDHLLQTCMRWVTVR